MLFDHALQSNLKAFARVLRTFCNCLHSFPILFEAHWRFCQILKCKAWTTFGCWMWSCFFHWLRWTTCYEIARMRLLFRETSWIMLGILKVV